MTATRFLACAIPLMPMLLGHGLHAQQRLSEDRDLKEYDLAAWDCLDQPGGSAKTPDGVERNHGKNRSPIDVPRDVPKMDTAAFLKHVSPFDSETIGKRRKDLTPEQRVKLGALEKQVVSLEAWLVIVYAGPPESTNCGNIDLHDWHLELFERPLNHAPGIGDPTPIICEIAPRTQNALFKDGVRLQQLSGFFRKPDIESERCSQPAQRVRVTGFLLWDDDHNGKADVGATIQRTGRNKYHQPWRSTAWEIHPVLKIERADGAPISRTDPSPAASPPLLSQPSVAKVPAPGASATPSPGTPLPAISAVAAPPSQQMITLTEPVRVKIPYGETTLPRGMKLLLVTRDSQFATVRYMGQDVPVPLGSTNLR